MFKYLNIVSSDLMRAPIQLPWIVPLGPLNQSLLLREGEQQAQTHVFPVSGSHKISTVSTERSIPTNNKQRFGSVSLVIGKDSSMAEQESGLELYYAETKYSSHSQQCSSGINASLSTSCDPTSVLDRRSLTGAQ